jgi:hypothetical protein
LFFHAKISDGEALDLIEGKFLSPKVENIASLVLEAMDPRKERCF